MKVSFLLLFSFFISICSINAQEDGILISGNGKDLPIEKTITITGKVVDEDTGNPLEYSTVRLYSLEDSVVIAGDVTDNKGRFSIAISKTAFYIEIEFFAYKTKTIDKVNFRNGRDVMDLGTIKMELNPEVLGTVEVRAKKSSVMMTLDKRVFNVGQDLVSQGGTAEDILRNVPGVWVDINGEVTLRSSEGVLILLDGQNSLLVDGENSEGLRQIQASSIESIEIITNASAKYEAGGSAGVINIILKKNDKDGFNGGIGSNLGHPHNYGFGVNMNYRKKKINLFAAAGIWYIQREGTGEFRNRFFHPLDSDSTLFSNMDRTHKRRGVPINAKVGIDYYLNPSNTLTSSFSHRQSNDDNTSELIYRDGYGSIDNVYLITQRQENEEGKESNFNGFLRHRKKFSKKKHSLTSEIRYEREIEVESSIFDEKYLNGNKIPIDTIDFDQSTHNESRNNLLIARSDYVLPLEHESKFEAGFQSSFRTIGNDYMVNNIINDVSMLDTNFTNNFSYDEIIHGVYANYGSKIKNFSFQTGLRMEYSNIKSRLNTGDGLKHSKYLSFFPSAFVGYNFKKDNGIQLSYSRRIERPTFLDLNPFFTIRDRRNIWKGNPNIRPEFTHVFEFGYIKYWDKGTLSAMTYYRRTKDVIKRIQRLDDRFPETTITQTENLDIKENFGIEFTYTFTLYEWWKLNGDMNFFHSSSEGTYNYQGEDVYVGGESFSLTSKTTTRFTFWKKLNTQATFSYSAPRTTTQGVNRAAYSLNLAASMDLLKNNGTITLSATDIFNTNRRRSYSEDETFYSEDNFLWQSRSIILSFHYRLNQHKKQSQIYSSPIKEDNEEQF